MSEHQYYEFQPIDRPLSDAEQTAVTRLSSGVEVEISLRRGRTVPAALVT